MIVWLVLHVTILIHDKEATFGVYLHENGHLISDQIFLWVIIASVNFALIFLSIISADEVRTDLFLGEVDQILSL